MGDVEKDEKKYDVQAVKTRLSDFRDAEREIDNQLERYERLQTKMYSIGSPQITDMPRSTTPSNDKMTNLLALSEELKEEINALVRAHNEERKQIESITKTLKKSDERAVIRMRYLDSENWSDVCFSLYGGNEGYDDNEPSYMRRLMRIHGNALLNMAKAIGE